MMDQRLKIREWLPEFFATVEQHSLVAHMLGEIGLQEADSKANARAEVAERLRALGGLLSNLKEKLWCL